MWSLALLFSTELHYLGGVIVSFKLCTSFRAVSCQMAVGGAEHALDGREYLLTEIYWSKDCQQSWCNVSETGTLSRDILQVKMQACWSCPAVGSSCFCSSTVLNSLAQSAGLPCSVLSSLSEINPVHVHRSCWVWGQVSDVGESDSNKR